MKPEKTYKNQIFIFSILQSNSPKTSILLNNKTKQFKTLNKDSL